MQVMDIEQNRKSLRHGAISSLKERIATMKHLYEYDKVIRPLTQNEWDKLQKCLDEIAEKLNRKDGDGK